MKPKRATIIYNPISGRKLFRQWRVRKMIRLLEQRGIAATAVATSGPNTGSRAAREAIDAGSEVIICHGGDGTLNEVLQGVACGKATLAVWAGGTANVVARDLNIPRRLDKVADVIATGKTKKICLGKATSDGWARYFLMFAGIGLDASICRGVMPGLKRLVGQGAFWVSGIQHFIAWPENSFLITVDGESYESGFSLIANGKGYGGGIRIAPGARLDEAAFQVFIMPRSAGRLKYLRALLNAVAGSTRTGGRLVKTQCLLADSDGETWVEVDGEPIGRLPMTFTVVPEALTVIIP